MLGFLTKQQIQLTEKVYTAYNRTSKVLLEKHWERRKMAAKKVNEILGYTEKHTVQAKEVIKKI